MEKVKHFTYFDGLNTFEVSNYSFEGNLAGEYDVVCRSFVKVADSKIELLENRKSLHNFQDRYFTLEQLEVLEKLFNMNLVKDELSYSLTVKGHYHGFDIVENDNLIVIYSLEGTKAPEYMFIYGVWKKK